MIPLSDGIRARRFPWVNVTLIVANFAVWIFYELPHLNMSVHDASFYPCTVDGSWNVQPPIVSGHATGASSASGSSRVSSCWLGWS